MPSPCPNNVYRVELRGSLIAQKIDKGLKQPHSTVKAYYRNNGQVRTREILLGKQKELFSKGARGGNAGLADKRNPSHCS